MGIDSICSVDIFDLSDNGPVAVKDVKLPYIVKKHTIFSPGTHNDMYYGKDTIMSAYSTTNWDKRVRALYLDHKDEDAATWLGYVENIQMRDDGFVLGDLEVWDLNTAIKLMGGAKFGISPRVKGAADRNKVMQEFYFENFSIVLNPAVKTTYLNSEVVVEDKKEDVKMSEEEIKIPPKEEVKEEAPAVEPAPAPAPVVAEAPKEEPKAEVPAAENSEVLKKLDKMQDTISEMKTAAKPEEVKEDPVAKEMADMKAKIAELEEKAKKPVRATVAASEMKDISDVSLHDADKGMMNLLRDMEGLPPVE